MTENIAENPEIKLFNKLDDIFEKRMNVIFYISLFLLVLFSILLFDVRVSEGGDDSGYLHSAQKFIEGKSFPSFHGAFYSVFNGIIIKIFGFHLILFKVISLLFLIGGHILMFYSLRNRISPFLLGSILLIGSVSSGLIYFGSQTYTEAFYYCLQALYFLVFLKYIKDRPNTLSDIKISWKCYLLQGVVVFMLVTTRNVGLVALLAILFVFAVEKRFYQLLFTVLGYLPFSILYKLYKKIVWDISGSDMSSQGQIMLQKHPYDATQGTEDFSGLITRVIENLKNYLSRVFLHETGLKNIENKETSLFVAILIVSILLLGLILAFRNKNRVMKFILIYLGMSLGVTFIALHQMWGQARLIIVFVPLILLGIGYSFGQLSVLNKFKAIKWVVPILFTFVFFKSFTQTAAKAKGHQEVLTKNLAGNKYYGYTPDWTNFLKMSEWVSKNIPNESMVVSRKPSMSFIYANGREFYPMYRIPVQYADSVIHKARQVERNILIAKETDIQKLAQPYQMGLKQNMLAAIWADNVLYSFYTLSNTDVSQILPVLEQYQIGFFNSVDDFEKQVLSKSAKKGAIDPDELLDLLNKGEVEYVIIAQLRVNPSQKTNRTINTVTRYMSAIQLKYPGLLTKVHQVGLDNNEPAVLYKIQYSRYGIKRE